METCFSEPSKVLRAAQAAFDEVEEIGLAEVGLVGHLVDEVFTEITRIVANFRPYFRHPTAHVEDIPVMVAVDQSEPLALKGRVDLTRLERHYSGSPVTRTLRACLSSRAPGVNSASSAAPYCLQAKKTSSWNSLRHSS